MLFDDSNDSIFIAVGETSNSYLISHNINIDNDYAVEIFRAKLKKYKGDTTNCFFIDFEIGKSEEINNAIYGLMGHLKKYEIGDDLFNIDHKQLSNYLTNFIENFAPLGITRIPFNKSLIPYEVIESVIPIIRMNVNRKDEDILNRYLPEILKIREIYSNQNKYENITKLVNKIYLSPTHNFKDSFFDQKGKHLEKLYYDRHNWYGFGTNKSDSMLAIGAFGFNDPKGIFFLAFHRLISHIEGLKNKKDWRSLDFLLPQLI